MAQGANARYVIAIAVAALIGALALRAAHDGVAPVTTIRPIAVAKATEGLAITSCRNEREQKKAAYWALFNTGKYWEAARSIAACHVLLDDPELKGMVSSAELKHWTRIANDRKASPTDRLSAIQALDREHPKEAAAFAPLLASLQQRRDLDEAKAKKRAADQERAARRKQGVSIGMSPEEVLQSAWGKPRHVNRSTYSFGVHEQWVYDGGYLYFEDDKLTAIQN